MSDWVVLDISAITKTTNREKVLKILKAGGMTVCKVTDPYMSEKKLVIMMKRSHLKTTFISTPIFFSLCSIRKQILDTQIIPFSTYT